MSNLTSEQGKAVRLMALAMMPFIAFFAFEILCVLPHRPAAPDVLHGYTIPLGLEGEGKTVYISVIDCVLTFGPFLCAGAICLFTFWRTGLFNQIRRR